MEDLESRAPRRRGVWASFEVAGFRAFFLASLCIFSAVNALILVRGYLVFELTGSFAALGSVAMASVIPGVLANVYGSVIADRWSRRVVIQVGQACMALLALGVGALIATGRLELWHLIVSAGLQGGIFGVIAPSWHSILPEIVGMDRVMNATALNLGGMNTVRLAVPAACGYLLTLTGPEVAYLGIGGLLCMATLALGLVPRPDVAPPRPAGGGSDAGSLLDGLRYAGTHPVIWMLVLGHLAVSLLSQPFLHLLPGFVKDVLGGGPDLLGGMVSLSSVGALLALGVVASMPSRRRGWILLGGSVVTGGMLAAFASATVFWVSLPALAFIGAGQSLRNSLSHALCQGVVDDAYRGRVMGMLALQMHVAQLGTFVVGLAAEWVGARAALAGMGFALAVTSLVFLAAFGPVRRLQ